MGLPDSEEKWDQERPLNLGVWEKIDLMCNSSNIPSTSLGSSWKSP